MQVILDLPMNKDRIEPRTILNEEMHKRGMAVQMKADNKKHG